MSKLIIIRGNSGSGKSTIAKQLQKELGYGAMLIPQDVVRREIIRTKDVPNNPSIQLMKDMALYGRDIGYDVIIEGICNTKKYGAMLRELVGEFDNVYAYYLDISFEETLRRHKTKPNAHEFGETEMRTWYKERDLLGLQNETLFSDDLTQEEIVRRIRLDVGSSY